MGDSRVIPSLLAIAFYSSLETGTPAPATTAAPIATPAPIATATPSATPPPVSTPPLPPAVTPPPLPEQTPVPPVVREHAEGTIEQYKAPVDVLTERMIGVASRAVRFDWRRKQMGVGVTGGELLEMNNFKSRKIGVSARRPFGGMLGDLSLNWVETQGSPSTEKLALTPYRQVGRPSRLELDVNLGYPLAEGVATSRPGRFPATELVFSAQGGLRYLHYPGSIYGADVRKVGEMQELGRTIFAPALTRKELRYLEDERPGGMEVDRARYNLLGGLGADVYFHNGGYVTPRALLALPVTGGELGWWWELTLEAGWMF